jgi:hypothetical protein
MQIHAFNVDRNEGAHYVPDDTRKYAQAIGEVPFDLLGQDGVGMAAASDFGDVEWPMVSPGFLRLEVSVFGIVFACSVVLLGSSGGSSSSPGGKP